MAEFPAKVSTQTSTLDVSSGLGFCPGPDFSFLTSIPGILMLVEIVLGLLVWALVASTYHTLFAANGWILFVTIFCWILTIILFSMLLLQLTRRISFVSWPLTVLFYHVVATILYITAFITLAATVNHVYRYNIVEEYNKKAAASFFACVVMIAYGASTVLSFMEWRGSGSNA
ncbi:membrane raft polarization, partial [Pristimantis euphronides]